MTLQELLKRIKQLAETRKPLPVETNGMKSKGTPIND